MNIRPSRALLAAVLALLAPFVLAAEETPARELAALQKRVAGHGRNWIECYKEMRPEFEAFVKKHPGTEEAATGRLWLFRETWWLSDGIDPKQDVLMHEPAGRIADELLAEHPLSPQLGEIAECIHVLAPERRAQVLQKLLDASTHAAVKAAAHLGLGQAGATDHFKILAEKYAALPYHRTTFGAMADAYLHPHPAENLAVGKPAPEIIGATHDDKPLKLSDFRGKVVVLDFWGDW